MIPCDNWKFVIQKKKSKCCRATLIMIHSIGPASMQDRWIQQWQDPIISYIFIFHYILPCLIMDPPLFFFFFMSNDAFYLRMFGSKKWRSEIGIEMDDSHSNRLIGRSPVPIPGWNENSSIYIELNLYSSLWI